MRLPVVLVTLLLAVAAAHATVPFNVEEVPQPFGGELGYLWLSPSGLVAGCLERGEADWLPFAWNPSRGMRLIETGSVAPEWGCSVAGASDAGELLGYVPYTSWRPRGAFLWSDEHGLEIFDFTPFTPGLLMNRSGQLMLVDGEGRFGVRTRAEGFIEIDVGERRLGPVEQNNGGFVWGELYSDELNGYFIWSRARGVERFLDYVPSLEYPIDYPYVERVSEDGYAVGSLPNPANPDNELGFVRSPDGTIHPFSLGPYIIAINAIGRDGLVVGTGFSLDRGEIAFVFQPGFGVEVLRSPSSPYTRDSATDVNADNVVVGQFGDGSYSRTFIWDRAGGVATIGYGAGISPDYPRITDAGWVVSVGADAMGRYRPFLWSRGTGILGHISWGNDNGYGTYVYGVSADGVAIGTGLDAQWLRRPFVFVPRLGSFDPREWLPPLEPASVGLSGLTDAGEFLIFGDDAVDGRRRYFLLTPVVPGQGSLEVSEIR